MPPLGNGTHQETQGEAVRLSYTFPFVKGYEHETWTMILHLLESTRHIAARLQQTDSFLSTTLYLLLIPSALQSHTMYCFFPTHRLRFKRNAKLIS